uniref:PD-(D/E)XK nuclease domain-containing protein n=1 Tax=Bacilliculturomica massiliensis TaxID=1917867 RepID=UPI002ED2008A
MDSQEAFYHRLLSGLYRGMPGYLVKSNRESGDGRPDLVLEGPRYRDRAVILELKTAKRVQEMEESSEEAVRQIREKKYREGLHAEGYEDVIAYGIAFYRKDCVVKVYES